MFGDSTGEAFAGCQRMHIPRTSSAAPSEFSPLLGGTCDLQLLPSEALHDLETIGAVACCDAGDILFMEQQPLHSVCIVLAGEVVLSLQDVNGRKITVYTAKRGAVLGMSEALTGNRPQWSAEVLYTARIASIKRRDFLDFAERHPEVYQIAVNHLIRKMKGACTTLRIVGLSYSADKRLASQLLEWGEQGQKVGEQTRYHLALTHTQIAEFVGTARETVSRVLGVLKQLGLVEIRGSMLIIPNTTALRRYAERSELSYRVRRSSCQQARSSR